MFSNRFYSALNIFLFILLLSSIPSRSISQSHKLHINESQANKQLLKLPSDPLLPIMRDGRHYPIIPSKIDELVTLIVYLEGKLRDINTPKSDLPLLAHQQQVIYRILSEDSERSSAVLSKLPSKWRKIASRHLLARMEFLSMASHSQKISELPAWEIVNPEPLDTLLSYYQQAESDSGIEWEVLAAINLVETGMGRIVGPSTANAQGPMQFLPTTWDEPGIGNGNDIYDAYHSIQAAARYLVRRGGLDDIHKGLWGYNNSDAYGRAVMHYAELMKADPLAYIGLYHWEIHFRTGIGDLWLPVGYRQSKKIPVSIYLKQMPASAPPAYSYSN